MLHENNEEARGVTQDPEYIEENDRLSI